MDWYFIAKWLHILSSSVRFGTGIGTAFQMVCAMHTKRVETIASVSASVCMADLIFTTPAGLFQPLSGLWLVYLQGYALAERPMHSTWSHSWLGCPSWFYNCGSAIWQQVPWLQAGRLPNKSGATIAFGSLWAGLPSLL
jgi:uncharacterized membrane protein